MIEEKMVHPTVQKSLKGDDGGDDFGERGPGAGAGAAPMFMHDSSSDGTDDGSLGPLEDDFKAGWGNFSHGYSQGDMSGGDSRSRHSSLQSEAARISKDEKIAREAGINFSIDQIVGLPMDEFNDLLSRHELNEEQLNICRDIRRRGKNKVAAQNCRRRKIDQLEELKQRDEESRQRGVEYAYLHERTVRKTREAGGHIDARVDDILRHHNLDPRTHTLKWVGNEIVMCKKPINGPEPPGSLRARPKEEVFHLPDFPLPPLNRQYL